LFNCLARLSEEGSVGRHQILKQTKNGLFIPPQETPYLSLSAHHLTWEQDLSHLKKSLIPEDLNHFLKLHTEAQNNPNGTKKEVEKFLLHHPGHPEALNLLTFICLSKKKTRRANQLIEENYKKNPRYIFAKINYADLCLRQKKHQKVPQIFNHTFDLKRLYPKKETFHVSEFRGFLIVMGLYHLAIGKRGTAEDYHYLAQCVDPHHPGTQLLGEKLYRKKLRKGLFFKYLNKFFQRNIK